jgi:adenylylsulfate kinase
MRGQVFWITGLSGSGKTTLASEIHLSLKGLGVRAIFLDGDELRKIFFSSEPAVKNYNKDERLSLGLKYSNLCELLASQGFTVIIATISMFKEVYVLNRKQLPNYFEIYLKVPYGELRRRDSKQIYSQFEQGKINNVMGLDLPIQEPEAADLVVDFQNGLKPKDIANKLITKLKLPKKY